MGMIDCVWILLSIARAKEEGKEMRKKLLLTIITASILLSGCISKTDDPIDDTTGGDTAQEQQKVSSDYATKETPADPTEKQTVNSSWGTFSFKVDNIYLGESALDRLSEMGENTDDYSDNQDGFRLTLLEYTVSADSGFEDVFEAADVTGGNMWDVNFKSKYEYYVHDLYENANLDYYNLKLKNGEESKMYILYELPEDAKEYVTCIDGMDKEYWYLYKLEE